MQLTIEIRLNNGDPCRVVYEDGAIRKFNIEIPGTSKDQVNEAKLIQAAQGLAAYEDVIPSLVNELNDMMNVPEEPPQPSTPPQPPAGIAIDMSGEPHVVSTEITEAEAESMDPDSSGYEDTTRAEAELENDPVAKDAFPFNGGEPA